MHPLPTHTHVFDTLFEDPRRQADVDSEGTQEEIAAQSQLGKWYAEIEKVEDEKAFTGSTPATEQELHAELHLLTCLYTIGEWHQVDNAWQAGLLPEGQLLRRKSDGFVGFVLRAYTGAALCWPARPLELNLWVADLEVEELTRVVCFAIGGFEVLPSEWPSPLHLILEDSIK